MLLLEFVEKPGELFSFELVRNRTRNETRETARANSATDGFRQLTRNANR